MMTKHPRTVDPTQAQKATRLRQERLIELAAFLHDRRVKLAPELVGLQKQAGRRTAGLRREEVAARAGVSVDWYVRIEQGRDVNPSKEVLDALAQALLLNEAERQHLHILASRSGDGRSIVSDASVQKLLVDALTHAPALLLDPRWDVLAQNAASEALWGAWHHLPEPHNNLLYQFFVDPCFTEQLEDWERHARIVVRQYRAVFVREMSDPRFAALIHSLANVSPAFSTWWDGTDIGSRDDGRKVFYHPRQGRLCFDYVVLRSAAHEGTEIIAFLPTT